MKTEGKKTIARNKKANHDYFLLEHYDLGIVLKGTEIKSIRSGKVSIQDAYCHIKNNEMWIVNMHIGKYEQGNIFNHDETRTRKLLAHRSEIKKLLGKTTQEGLTLIPLAVYLEHGFAKIEIALAKGKKLYDKRDDSKVQEAKRQIQKVTKERNRRVY